MSPLVAVAAITLVLVVKAEATTFVAPEVISIPSNQTCPSQRDQNAARSRLSNKVEVLLQSMEFQPSCGSGLWRRIAYLDMSDPSQSCPSAWGQFTSPYRGCGKQRGVRCDGVNYSTGGISYTQVCGRITAFPQSTIQTFRGARRDIDGPYLDGVSVTHGQPRQHIWSFVAGAYSLGNALHKCPCDGGDPAVPSFVGSNYFCEGALLYVPSRIRASLIWDGTGCFPLSCCSFNSPPWFKVTLPAPTDDSIEVRICSGDLWNGAFNNENTPVTLIEIYVK